MFYIAVVGRPNVGKSTFFNKMVGGRPAIVDDTAGVTRDRNIAVASRGRRRFAVIDSGGFEPESQDKILSQMREQTLMAIEEADLIFFMVDGRDGITPVDEEIARRLRKSGKKVFLIVNKMDNPARHDEALEFTRLGIEPIFAVSAEHSIGVEEALEAAIEDLPEEPETAGEEEEEAAGPAHVAIVGKPNVGKSSLVNRMLGATRMMVSDVPGTTRDAIDSEISVDGRKMILIDTAGIRRKSKVTQKLEKFSVIMAMKAIERADVVLMLIDASEGVAAQEAKIAGMVEEAGKGLVIVVNKWDIVEKDEKTSLRYEDAIRRQLKFVAHAPIVFVSAKTGQRVDKIWRAVDEVFAQYSRRINTSELNELIAGITSRKQPPMAHGRRVKIYYATQSNIKPPTFVLMTNDPDGVHFSYRRYIVNQIRDEAGFDKTPIRLFLRKPAGRRSRAEAIGKPGRT